MHDALLYDSRLGSYSLITYHTNSRCLKSHLSDTIKPTVIGDKEKMSDFGHTAYSSFIIFWNASWQIILRDNSEMKKVSLRFLNYVWRHWMYTYMYTLVLIRYWHNFNKWMIISNNSFWRRRCVFDPVNFKIL